MQTNPTHPRRVDPTRLAHRLLVSLTLLIAPALGVQAQSGTWTRNVSGDASGSWDAAANWAGNVIANGQGNTADFSTLDITTNSIVTLDGARTIGNLLFGDTTPDTNWVIETGSGGPLTLSVAAGSPAITVNNQTATIATMVSGTQGLTKAGAGTLVLNTVNDYTGDTIVAAGILSVVGPANANANLLGATTAITDTTNNIVVVQDGATFQINPNTRVPNKKLFISGTGVGGTQGAFYANATGTGNGTRWGVGAAAVLDPVLTLDADATLRVDGDASGANTANLLVRSVGLNGFTLTKSGSGRLQIDNANGVVGEGTVHLAEGVLGFRGGAFSGNRSLIIDTGAGARIGGDNNAMNSTVNTITVNGTLDLNARGNGNPGSDTTTFSQTIGVLSGNGTITSGTFGNTGVQNLTIQNDIADSTFSGTITQNNGIVNINKGGTTQLTLSGDISHDGTTTVNGGTLLITGTYTGGGNFSVNPGGILAGTTTISSIVTNNGGIIMAGDPSNPGGTLTIDAEIIGAFSGSVVISNANLAVDGFIGESVAPVGALYMKDGALQIPLPTLGASVFVGTLEVDGNATINFSMDTPLLGQFPIISYQTIGGTAGFSGLSVVPPAGVTAHLVENSANSTIDVVITDIPAVFWAGTPNGNWDIGTTTNWQGGVAYTEPDLYVIFDDSAPGTTTVSLTTTLSPEGVIVNNDSLNYTFTGSGHLSGTGGILKQGSGTLTVANSGNDLTGGLSLEEGTVQVGNGGTTGDLGSGAIANLATLALNRSDTFALGNIVSGPGAITKAGAGTATVPVSGDNAGAVTVNAGTLTLGPIGTSTFSGDVTGSGAFGVNGPGTLILSGFGNTYSGGTVITSGTLQFGDANAFGTFPPAGNITVHGTLATTISGTLANNISGTGGVAVISNAMVTLTGNNSYSGPTVVSGTSGSVLDATATTYPAGSALTLGSQTGAAERGTVNFTAGNPVLGGLHAGDNSGSGDVINLSAGNQTLTINGDVTVGNIAPVGASVLVQVNGTGASVVVNTNGGTIQIGLGAAGSGVNPDNILVDLSLIDRFIANLGETGAVNLGTLDQNPGPTTGATVVNQFILASVSNSISAGTITIGAGGRQLIPELRLGTGANRLNVNTLNVGTGGRDGGALLFNAGTGSLRVRGFDGVSRANMNVGVNTATGTGANVTNNVDLTGGDADLLLGALVIGNYPLRGGINENTFTFSQGMLDALSVSLSAGKVNNANPASSTLNIGGGTASLGDVSLTASPAAGTLNIIASSVTVHGITDTGTGISTLDVNNSTLNVDLQGFGNPATAPISVDVFNANGAVNVGVDGIGLTPGQFPLIQYTGVIGGAGFPALTLATLPTGVVASLANNEANQSVDLVITSAPPPPVNPFPTDLITSVNGNQLTLSWPPGHLGWQLQSNSVGLASDASWFLVPGSTGTTNVVLTIDPGQDNVFYRMNLP